MENNSKLNPMCVVYFVPIITYFCTILTKSYMINIIKFVAVMKMTFKMFHTIHNVSQVEYRNVYFEIIFKMSRNIVSILN